MEIIKTKNINLVLYSVIRQLMKGDTLAYTVQDGKPVNITFDKCTKKRNSMLVMMVIANIKRALNNDKHVIIKIGNWTECGITKEEGYYYIDNAEVILKHVIFELILESNEIVLGFNIKELANSNEKYYIVPCYQKKSEFFNDYFDTKEIYDLTEEINKKIVEYYASKNEDMFITNKREIFMFNFIM